MVCCSRLHCALRVGLYENCVRIHIVTVITVFTSQPHKHYYSLSLSLSLSPSLSLSNSDPEEHRGVLQGHSDAVWDLAVHPKSGLLLSCGADGSVRLWNHTLTSPQVKLFETEPGTPLPPSVC